MLSIRQRLTLWYMLMLMLMLLVFAALVYGGGIVVMRESSDRDLLVRGRLLADELSRHAEPTVLDTPYRVVALDGKVDRVSGLPVRRVAISPAALAAAGKGQTYRETITSETPAPAAQTSAASPRQVATRLRVLTLPLGTPPHEALQVGEVLRYEDRFTSLTLLILAGILVLGLPLAALGGWWLAGRALAPARALAEAARRIESADLSERLPVAQDELGALAAAFNDLLVRLEAAFQRERRFIADVSHDLRTPLALIKSTIGVTLNRPRSGDELRAALADVDAQVDRVSALLEATLFLSRADTRELGDHLQPVDLSELLADLSETTSQYAHERYDQRLTGEVAPGLSVCGDRDQLTRLFMNLLDNAMHYTPRGGEIGLSAEASDAEVLIVVRDNGVGIAADDLPHIFDRFYRADTARGNTGVQHHGLGLAIAQAIAAGHGGRISATSALGRGSAFTVALPRLA